MAHPTRAQLLAVVPTPAHLEQALRQLRCHGWPLSVEACLAHAVYGPCLRVRARQLARAELLPRREPAAPARPEPVLLPPAPHKPAPTSSPTTRPWFDARKAAANDFDHDDD